MCRTASRYVSDHWSCWSPPGVPNASQGTPSRVTIDGDSVVRGRTPGRTTRLAVGVADALPKMLVRRLLEPAAALPEPIQLVCREDKTDALLADLAQFRLDLVLADTPVPPTIKIKAFSHLLGETGVTWFAAPGLAAGWVLAFARGIGEFGATLLFAGSVRGETQTLTLGIYEQLQSDFDVALAIGILLVCLSAVVLLCAKLLASWRRSSSTSPFA